MSEKRWIKYNPVNTDTWPTPCCYCWVNLHTLTNDDKVILAYFSPSEHAGFYSGSDAYLNENWGAGWAFATAWMPCDMPEPYCECNMGNPDTRKSLSDEKKLWDVYHIYDVDGGFGDAVTLDDKVATVFATDEEIDTFVKEWDKPEIYDRPYSDLWHHHVLARPVEVTDDINEVKPYYTDDELYGFDDEEEE